MLGGCFEYNDLMIFYPKMTDESFTINGILPENPNDLFDFYDRIIDYYYFDSFNSALSILSSHTFITLSNNYLLDKISSLNYIKKYALCVDLTQVYPTIDSYLYPQSNNLCQLEINDNTTNIITLKIKNYNEHNISENSSHDIKLRFLLKN
jgi:hypothetical protein